MPSPGPHPRDAGTPHPTTQPFSRPAAHRAGAEHPGAGEAPGGMGRDSGFVPARPSVATRSSGSSAEEASQLAVPLGRCGKGGSWAEPLAEASSPGLRAPGEVGLRGTWPRRLERVVSGSSAADPWLGCGSLPTRFGALGLGQHCQLGGQRLTKDTECGRGSEEIRGVAGGAGHLVSPFPAALRRPKGELHSLRVLCSGNRNLSPLMEQTKM